MTPSKLINSLGRGFIPRPKNNSVISSFLVSFIRPLEIGNSASTRNIKHSMISANFWVKTLGTKKESTICALPPVPPSRIYTGGNNA